MTNPLDDAFAEAEDRRATAKRANELQDRLAKQAARDWLDAYRELLDALPRHVDRPAEAVTLGWSPGEDPPPAISIVGKGKYLDEPFAFGTCDAWSFPYGRSDEKGNRSELYVSEDCTTVFKSGGWRTIRVRSGLRSKSVLVDRLGDFADISTGRHTLRQTIIPQSRDDPSGDMSEPTAYRVTFSNLPNAKQLAQIIAGLEPDKVPGFSGL